MKKQALLLLGSLLLLANCNFMKTKGQYTQSLKERICMLLPAPTTITSVQELVLIYNDLLAEPYNNLTPEERIFMYYLYRASLPGNRILGDQIHRSSNDLITLFEGIYNARALITQQKMTLKETIPTFDHHTFVEEVKTFLIYLWSNHSQYFQREHSEEKRTPSSLGLTQLSYETLHTVLTTLRCTDLLSQLEKIGHLPFDSTREHTSTVPNSINNSAINIYATGFTDDDYDQLPTLDRGRINAYFDVTVTQNKRTPTTQIYAIGKKYDQELSVSAHWLIKARDHALKYPAIFDKHVATSLDHLITFLQTGNEEDFRMHSIEWLKTKSRIDYCFGFIEVYHDPKGVRGFFQAEATIKTIDLEKLNAILPALEEQLPLPAAYKRTGLHDGSASVPNASINVQVFGTGALGPLNSTAAYCLPNYDDIRAQHGSKQIIYPAGKSIGQRLNPTLARRLFNLNEHVEWLLAHDPEGHLSNDLWDVQCILHETMGHASGKLDYHVFKQGDQLTIEGTSYKIGDRIAVTPQNLSEFLAGYESTIEELRAEIIALYVSIYHTDTLIKQGMLNKWTHLLTLEELQDRLILAMAKTGLTRLLQQNEKAQQVNGDHARANCTIMWYLIDHGGLKLKRETFSYEGSNHEVVGLIIKDRAKTFALIKELLIEVQRIKSTGDGQAAAHLIETYGKPLRDRSILETLHANRKKIMGNIKATVTISPLFTPVDDEQGNIIDIKAEWPQDFFHAQQVITNIMLSKS